VRKILLAATMRKIQNRFGEARFEDPYLENYILPTPPLTPGRRSRCRAKDRRTLIVDDDIPVEMEADKKATTKTLIFLKLYA
jgi:hypothetical protein